MRASPALRLISVRKNDMLTRSKISESYRSDRSNLIFMPLQSQAIVAPAQLSRAYPDPRCGVPRKIIPLVLSNIVRYFP
jgi:hypothetical protein